MTDAALTPTPNDCPLPRRRADFATFNEAIDYAALSQKGLNFHDMRGTLIRPYTFTEMREDALVMARRLIAAGTAKEDRVALIAETGADFAAMFCACVYAGAWPVPLPLPTTRKGYPFPRSYKRSYRRLSQLISLSSADFCCGSWPESSVPTFSRMIPCRLPLIVS